MQDQPIPARPITAGPLPDRSKSNIIPRAIYVLTAALACLLIIYTVGKAYTTSFTIDESFSYLNIKTFFVRIIHMQHKENLTTISLELNRITGLFSANTHILNSLMMAVSSAIFGDSELSLRLPNLAAHVLFLYYSFKFLRHALPAKAFLLAFIIVNTNPFVLDFFSVARGYGLAISLMMMSLYHLYIYEKDSTHKKAHRKSYIFAMLAVYANFTLFNYYISLLILDGILSFQLSGKSLSGLFKRFREKDKALLAVNIIFMLVTLGLLTLLQKGKQFYVGSGGFFSGSIPSLITDSLYRKSYPVYIFRTIYLCVLSAASILSIGLCTTIYRHHRINGKFIPFILMLFSVLSCWIQHLLCKTPFPESRTGIYLVVLFTVGVVLIFPSENKYWQKTYILSIAFAAVFSVANLYRAVNFKYVLGWELVIRTFPELLSCFEEGRTDITRFEEWKARWKCRLCIHTGYEFCQSTTDSQPSFRAHTIPGYQYHLIFPV